SAAMLDILQVVQPEAAYQTPLFSGSYRETMVQDFNKSLRIAFSTKSPVGTPVSEDAKLAVEKLVGDSGGTAKVRILSDIDGSDKMIDWGGRVPFFVSDPMGISGLHWRNNLM
ncbi:hypothetical protein BLX88_23890, partial [Bacillus obstructivus]